MGRQKTRREVTRKTKIETLEDRQMFSADPLGGMLGGAIVHHAIAEPPLELHSEPVIEHHSEPSLVHHTEQTPDFCYDTNLETSIATLLGDIEKTLASASTLTGATQARTDYGFTGAGQTVAIIDSGIAWNHAALGGGLG